MLFKKILNKSGGKPSKTWVDKDVDKMLQDNDIEMHSTQNERKHVVAERFNRTLKNKIYKYMT